MKFLFLIFSISCWFFELNAQAPDSSGIANRIIFIGDAGNINKTQSALISDAASKILKGRTAVMYLGNNIYPRGMSVDNRRKQEKGQQILKSAYVPMRQNGAVVYFIPGTRDWDNNGPDGLSKIIEENTYLDSLQDTLLKMSPPGGCPDPQVINVSDNLIIIAMDTEWWLFSFNKNDTDTSCDCKTPQDVIGRLRILLDENKGKTIILATHHPSQSYGHQSGNFSLKDNLFPLTLINSALYLPLPFAGSLYPLFRKGFPGREDLHHTNYQMMSESVLNVFNDFPNLIQVSSHEDGLQLIKGVDEGQLQIVAGIGKKQPFTKKGKNTIFNSSSPGFVIADLLTDGRIHLTFFAYRNKNVRQVFDFTKSYIPVRSGDNPTYTPIREDSLITAVRPSYNNEGNFFKFLFGKNYRHAWGAPVKLPVLHLSQIDGGLRPVKLGGGFETISMRLKNPSGKEYVLRGIDKTPDKIIPQKLLSPVTREIVSDAYSSQHPYSALIVPPIAEAVGVPHAHPKIGIVSPDRELGQYQSLFADKINLLEEREPLPKTDNFTEALKKLGEDNDNSYDAINFLKARMLDLLIGDWDRHTDQWRFHDAKKGKGKYYIVVPRDRDQVLSVTNGLFETIVRYFYLVPPVYGFKKNLLQESNAYLHKSNFLESFPASQISHDTWMTTVRQFRSEVTDSVLQTAMNALPEGLDTNENSKILSTLKVRRDLISPAMEKYYSFINRIIDIRGSDKKEFVSIDGNRDTLRLLMRKISKHGYLEDTLVYKNYPASLTKEIRLYLGKDEDSVEINNLTNIRLRIIGGKTGVDKYKSYFVAGSRRKIRIYDYKREHYDGDTSLIKKYISSDGNNTKFEQVNLLNTIQPLLTAGINPDDGFILGLGAKFIRQNGFRKTPYTSTHTVMISHSFNTQAFGFRYIGDWLNAVGKARFNIDVNIQAPENTQNFFGAGNSSVLDKTGNFMRFYRTRFDLYNFRPSLKWTGKGGNTFSVGPALQFYHYDADENSGRFITHKDQLNSFDSAVISKNKQHLGIVADYELDRRNNKILPAYGAYFHIVMQGFEGLNAGTHSYGQLISELAFYKNLNARQTFTFADRIGGAVTIGKPAFYQYAYLGGQGNLLGYRKFRFAGMSSLYNNLELRLALANFANTLFRGQIGLIGFYDVGRVWNTNEHSSVWHNGAGGGFYISPAYSIVFRFDIGFTPEGTYPSFGFGFRF